ncbi:alkylphosphonate utilization protein [Prosthecodimorpha staleyi]|uniref:Alkylphosphonate utilization protein n=1 Tax=Prosthecodimorpha staleyi TaxID=2840188 RepID=A0A947D2W1_9HYPH|nr:alkylphosphonate utilization protein [Prosthecodimorpha staleyi]MBT9289298.1 alkylphosphonate utilization protein [Prosthecodimorpha staleyi]
MSDDDYVYDEATGEWISPAEAKAKAAAGAGADEVEVRDSVGNRLADGDSVVLIKDLKVKGTTQTLRRGTVIKSIRLTGDAQEVDCRHETIRGLVLRAEFLRKH